MANDNQFGFFRDVQLNNGALVVTGITGGGASGTSGTSGAAGSAGSSGTSGTSGGAGGASGGTHFGWQLSPGTRYNLGITSDYIEAAWDEYANKITLFPVTPMRNVTISAMTMTNTNANTYTNAALIMCVYSHDVATNFPKDLILSSSTIGVTTNFAQNTFLTNYTFSAGTTYWLGYAFNGMQGEGGTVIGFGIEWYGLLTFSAPTNPGSGDEPFKMAINSTFTFPTLPNPFTGARYVGQTNPPEICIIPSA